MITITNTFYKKESDQPLFINKELLYRYKDCLDTYLVNIKRELTRSLVDYKLFQELQQVNNSVFVIIDYLDAEHYTYVKEVIDDKKVLMNSINTFLKHCNGTITKDIYDSIYDNCDLLSLTVNKLVEIVKTINEE